MAEQPETSPWAQSPVLIQTPGPPENKFPSFSGLITKTTLVVRNQTIHIVRPADPDHLLDDPQVLAWNRQDDYMPYWAYLWPGAYLLAEAVVSEPWQPETPALEIGCGLGLAGLVALARGLRVTFTDYDESPFRCIHQSADANGFPSSSFCTRLLDFRNLPSETFPIILGADILYEQRLVPLVANLLARTLAPTPGALALIAGPYRMAAEAFPAQVRSLGLLCESLPITSQTQAVGLLRGTLHRITRP